MKVYQYEIYFIYIYNFSKSRREIETSLSEEKKIQNLNDFFKNLYAFIFSKNKKFINFKK